MLVDYKLTIKTIITMKKTLTSRISRPAGFPKYPPHTGLSLCILFIQLYIAYDFVLESLVTLDIGVLQLLSTISLMGRNPQELWLKCCLIFPHSHTISRLQLDLIQNHTQDMYIFKFVCLHWRDSGCTHGVSSIHGFTVCAWTWPTCNESCK